ncbi:Plasma-membrane choline transporter [Musa troglodytarum]|uniref:Choline transporter-like protein n=1 Tax=Musa troglodytarum TaxID=320322 RepID=A0A9E7H9L6_9LILI|nr:Plasma-membrane choline transporter [Musa troglodytarum]
MGSRDEAQPSVAQDPFAAAAQPLLLPPAAGLVDPSASSPPSPDEDSYSPISYHHGRRPIRDLPALLLFLILSLATFALGIAAVARRNPAASHASSFVYDRSTSSCVLPSSNSFSSSSSSSTFSKDLIWTLVVTLLLAGPIALAVLWLLRHYAKQVVYASIPFFIVIPSFLNVYWFVACAVGHDCRHAFPLAYRIIVLVFVFLLIGIFLWIIVANLHRIELTIHIVRVSATALASNIGLLAVLPLLGIGLLAYFSPIIVFLVFSTWNGRVVPREVEGTGKEYYKCVWKQESWVPAYFAIAIITMIWSAATLMEAKVYLISGTVAQWYFNKEESRPSKSIRSSLRNAFGPSFGTVCFSGMTVGAVRVVRAIVDSGKQGEEARGFINLILKCCANFVLAAIDFVNKFTIIFAAITGEGYCSAAKMTYELLRRNLLSAVFVETVSTRILVGIIFVLSAFYAIAVCAILRGISALGMEMYFVAALAWLLLIVVLGYFVHVLDNVIDTIYVCYAIDRDKGEVCKQVVHEVYVLLPVSRNHGSSVNRSSLIP